MNRSTETSTERRRTGWIAAVLGVLGLTLAGCCCPPRCDHLPTAPTPGSWDHRGRQIGDGPFSVLQPPSALPDLSPPNGLPMTVPPDWERVGHVFVAGEGGLSTEAFRLVEGDYEPPRREKPVVAVGFEYGLYGSGPAPLANEAVPIVQFLLDCEWPGSGPMPAAVGDIGTKVPLERNVYSGWYAIWQGHSLEPVAFLQVSGEDQVYFLGPNYFAPTRFRPSVVLVYEWRGRMPAKADIAAASGWLRVDCEAKKVQ